MIDIGLVAIIAVVTWCVASEGAWGAAITLASVVLGGLLAMNFFESLAVFLERNVAGSYDWANRWDIIALVLLFAGFVTALRMASNYLAPVYISTHTLVHEGVRWGCGLATGYVTMAFLLTALHTAPLPREFMGFTPERQNLFGVMAPDRQWLGFTQYVSEKSLSASVPRLFDGPQFELPATSNRVWPSFPIRYATRRERIANPAPIAQAAPTVQQRQQNGPSAGF